MTLIFLWHKLEELLRTKLYLTLVLIATLIFPLSSSVLAQSSGATIIREFDCGINEEDSGIHGLLITLNTWAVVTPSGSTNFHCIFAIPPNLRPSHTMIHQSFLCSTQAGVTIQSRAVTTKSTVHLMCHINPSTPPYEPPPGGD